MFMMQAGMAIRLAVVEAVLRKLRVCLQLLGRGGGAGLAVMIGLASPQPELQRVV